MMTHWYSLGALELARMYLDGNTFNMITILGELNKPNTKSFHKSCALLHLGQHHDHYHTCNVVSPLPIPSTHHSPIRSSDNNNTSPHSWKTPIYPYTAPPILVAYVQHVALLPTNITPQHPLKLLQPYQHISQTPNIYTHLSPPLEPVAPPLGDPTHGTCKTIAITCKRMVSPFLIGRQTSMKYQFADGGVFPTTPLTTTAFQDPLNYSTAPEDRSTTQNHAPTTHTNLPSTTYLPQLFHHLHSNDTSTLKIPTTHCTPPPNLSDHFWLGYQIMQELYTSMGSPCTKESRSTFEPLALLEQMRACVVS